MNKLLYINKDKIQKLKKIALIFVSSAITVTTSIGCSQNEDINLSEYVSSSSELNQFDENDPSVALFYSDITDEDLQLLSPLTEDICFSNCNFITSLDTLPVLCPNLKNIIIDNCSSISNLDFIYNLSNIEKVYIYSNAFVSNELVDYLNSHNIKHNITQNDLDIAKEIDNIYNQIINDNMSDIDKIRAITLYEIKNYSYDISLTYESNNNPLDCIITNKKGVCASYSYLTNTLLRKAGINSYEVIGQNHSWNLIKKDDKYYYLDVTNLDANYLYLNAKLFNNSPFFMSDPSAVNFTSLTAYNEGENKIIIPKSIVDDIEKGEDLKTLNERYGTGVIAFYLKLYIPLFAIMTAIIGGKKYIQEINFKKEDNNNQLDINNVKK